MDLHLLFDIFTYVAASRRVTYEEWRNRSPVERVTEWFGWLLERQQ